jgi:hypothetical protein
MGVDGVCFLSFFSRFPYAKRRMKGYVLQSLSEEVSTSISTSVKSSHTIPPTSDVMIPTSHNAKMCIFSPSTSSQIQQVWILDSPALPLK